MVCSRVSTSMGAGLGKRSIFGTLDSMRQRVHIFKCGHAVRALSIEAETLEEGWIGSVFRSTIQVGRVGPAAQSAFGLILSTITTYRTRDLSQPPSQHTHQPST